MQRILFGIIALCISYSVKAQSNTKTTHDGNLKTFYSYTPDGRIDYEVSNQKILVKFKTSISFNEQTEIVGKYPLLKSLKPEMLLPSPKVSLLEINGANISTEKIIAMIAALNQEEKIVYANPFLVYKDGTLQGITERFFVKLKSASDYVLLENEAKRNKFTIGESNKHDKLLFAIEVDKNSSGNALELANKLSETRKFLYAEPDFLLLLKKFSTNDTYLNYQWSLNNTGSSIQYNGTPGADMNIFNAWTLSTGNSATKVAVIDEGVDLVHPDLIGNMLPGFDGTGLGSGGAPSGNDAHGTACAGIIAAVGNNNLGIAGVAYSAKIVPVRIAYGSGSSWITSNAWIGTCIDWAWDQGDADVLSNSWGGGGSSSVINDAIGRATTLGRGGLGAPVLFAAGNDNSAVSYPATLSNVISVTAMSMCNQRKSTSSCDGETFWGSNYGTNTDVSAPGVKIYTCDISGANGYSSGDYTGTFNGTSSATPNTAGVMALILSVNPSLTMSQARQILEISCDKVGGYTYNSGVANQPNGTWSNDLGYGRVNAFAALQLANPQPCINPPAIATTNASPSTICLASNINFSLGGILFGTGQTYQWQSSANNITYNNIGGATNSSYSATVSATTWYRCAVTCGSTTNSTPTQVVFNNPTISSFPYIENFDASSALPCGWSVIDANSDGFSWANRTTNPRSAPNAITYVYNVSSAANDWVFSAPLSLTAGTNYRVRFWYRARNASYPEKLEIKWGAAATALGMTSSAIFTNSNINNISYLEATTSIISPTTSGIYYVGFRAFSNADMWDLHIDDVTFEIAPSCATPLLGGTISGALNIVGGSPTTYTLTGNTGTNIQWEQSVNSGATWTNITGATTSTPSIVLSPGTVLLRAKSSSPASGCADVYSNILTITVNSVIGDVFSNPIIVSLPFTQAYSNASGSGYTSTYTGTNQQASPDIFFSFTTGPCADSIKISTCGSLFDTYVHLLNASGTNLTSNDDNGPYCTGTAASMKVDILPNTTYFAVFEGYGTATGTIQVHISEIGSAILVPFVSIAVTSGSNPMCAGSSITFTATPTNGGVPSYQWQVNGSNVGTNSSTFTSSSLTNGQAVTCIMTSTATCASPTTASSNSINMVVNTILTPSVSIAVTSGTNPMCAGSSITFTATPTNGGAPSYQWQVNGSNVGTNSSTFTSSSLTNGQAVTCIMTSTATCASPTTASSNSITMVVNPILTPSVSIAVTSGSNPMCAGSSITFTATPTNGGVPSYQWQVNGSNVGTNSATFTSSSLTNGQAVTCIMTSTATCASPTTASSNSINMVVNPILTPSVSIAVTSGANPMCAGSSITFTATPTNGGVPSYQWQVNGSNVGTNSSTFTSSSLTNGQAVTCIMTSTATCASPITASSNSINMVVNPILTPSVSIAVTSGTNPMCAGSSITFTATPTNGGIPSYQWQVNGSNVGTNSATYTSSTLTNGQAVTCIMTSTATCASPTTASSNSITMVVNPILTPSVSIAVTSGSNPMCAGSSITFTATPTNGGIPSYQWQVNGSNVGTNSSTFTSSSLTNGQAVTCIMTSTATCASPITASSNSINMVVNPILTPSVSIAVTSGSNPMCAGSSITFTATPTNGGAPSYQWQVNGSNVGTNSATVTSSTLTNGQAVTCIMTSTATCASPTTASSNSINMVVNTILTPSVSIAVTSGTNPLCAGSSITFTATPTNGGVPSYQWQVNGSNVGTNSSTFTSSTLTNGQAVTCIMTSTATCASPTTASSNSINMVVNPILTPSVSIAVTSGTNPMCAGSSITFTATPTNGGVPSYQWQVNGSNVGTNSATFTSSSLTNGQAVTCIMTSTATCASPTTATSNSINMVVNPILTPSVSIAVTSGSNPMCAGSSITFTATPTNGGAPSYQWQVNGSNVGTNSSTFTSSSLTNGQAVTCIMTSTATCASPTTASSNSINMLVNTILTPSVSIAVTSGSNPLCAGSSITFTATPTNGGIPSYQWQVNGSNVGTNSATFTSSTLTNGQAVTCIMTSTATCASPTTASSNSITMVVNPILTPSVSIAVTSGTNPMCSGSSITFTATPTNGGAPSYQWQVNGSNVGTNSSTFTSSSLTNGQAVTCIMTSTATCASPTTASSNSINMVVNSLPTVTAANVSGCNGNLIALVGSPLGGIFSIPNPYLGISTTYTYQYTDVNGCTFTSSPASVVVNSPSINMPQVIVACNTYTWAVNGITYTNSGIFTASFVNSSGCDSSFVLDLTIHSNSNSSSTISATNFYTWPANGITYSTSGIYTHTILNVYGCDSLLTLNLSITNTSPGIIVSPKVFLSGPYNTTLGLMHDSLRTNNLIPLTEPYSYPPYNFPQFAYSGGETMNASLLSISGNDAIIDWVYLELRLASNPTVRIATKRCLLQRDGDVVSHVDGISPISFTNELPGAYYVSIKHRNHIGVMTATAISLNSSNTVIDFTNNDPVWINPTIVNAPRKVEGNVRLLFSGDANFNKATKYNGYLNDKDKVLSAVGFGTPNNVVSGYRSEDVNMDSKVKYNGADNERGVILSTVGSNTPNTIMFQHTPN
ncbi:MAG: S8 family serine peptidase [Bacteroidetes bacterium]|nr:S8 family serine peptidase [Bacteroidota bacterium]